MIDSRVTVKAIKGKVGAVVRNNYRGFKLLDSVLDKLIWETAKNKMLCTLGLCLVEKQQTQ